MRPGRRPLRGLAAAAGLTMLLLGCAPAKPEKKIETIGDLLEAQCAEGMNGKWCEVLVMALEKDGSPESMARAKVIRKKACTLGDVTLCE